MALVINNPLANAGDARDEGLILGLGRSPGGRNGTPLQYLCLGDPMDRGASRSTVHEVTKTQTRLSTHAHAHTACVPGGRPGNVHVITFPDYTLPCCPLPLGPALGSLSFSYQGHHWDLQGGRGGQAKAFSPKAWPVAGERQGQDLCQIRSSLPSPPLRISPRIPGSELPLGQPARSPCV